MIKRADWLNIAKDRGAVGLLILLGLLVIILVVTTFARLHASDIQVPVRFTGYGQNNIYRDQWYTQLSYAGFGLLIAVANGFLAIKLYQLSRILSFGFMGLSIFVLILANLIANAIFNLAPTL